MIDKKHESNDQKLIRSIVDKQVRNWRVNKGLKFIGLDIKNNEQWSEVGVNKKQLEEVNLIYSFKSYLHKAVEEAYLKGIEDGRTIKENK